MSQHLPEPHEPSRENGNLDLDLSNYATKANFNWATGIDTSALASKADFASLKKSRWLRCR